MDFCYRLSPYCRYAMLSRELYHIKSRLLKTCFVKSYNSKLFNSFHRIFQLRPNLSNIKSKKTITTTKMSSKKSLIGVSQMRATNNKTENMQKVEKLVAMAKKECAQFLFLPECCDYVGENREQTLKLSEPLSGPTVTAYKNLAKTNKIWLSFGGIHESIMDKDGKPMDKTFNAHVVINELGEIAAVYRKLHLFDVVTPNFHFKESTVVFNGKEIIAPIQTPIGCLGLQICYDMRFGEVSTILRKDGAEILAYPSAFAYTTGKAHWDILLRSRAIENQCFVVASAQIGFHNKKRQSYGHGMIVSPWGDVIVDLQDAELDVKVVEIDLSHVENVRQNMPCFKHRRDDMYNLIPIEWKQCEPELVGISRNFANHVICAETIFYETKSSFAFTNLRCVVPGHVLVASKRSVPRLEDLSPEEVSDLFLTANKIQKLLQPIYNSTSSTLTVQDGPDAGQTVKHVHFHVMPRCQNDFKHNDQIYTELLELELADDSKNRKLDDMIEEAELYRMHLKNQI